MISKYQLLSVLKMITGEPLTIQIKINWRFNSTNEDSGGVIILLLNIYMWKIHFIFVSLSWRKLSDSGECFSEYPCQLPR